MKRLFAILTVLLVVVVAIYFWIKRKLDQLTYSVVDIKFKKISAKELSGTLSILIQNPFGNIEISNLKLDLFIDGYYVCALEQKDSKTELLPNGNLMAKVDFIISPKKVISMEHLLMSLANWGQNNYSVKGSITVKKWFVKVNLPIEYTAKFKE